jgi:hypothetical protein
VFQKAKATRSFKKKLGAFILVGFLLLGLSNFTIFCKTATKGQGRHFNFF